MAVEFEKQSSASFETLANGVSVIGFDGNVYAVSPMPDAAAKYKISPAKSDLEAFKDQDMDPGLELTEKEAQRVVEVLFENTAIDKESIRIRAFTIGKRVFAEWCDNFFIACANWQGRAGTYVTYEVNGRNRSGGMTGYEKQTILIRKRAAKN